MSTEREKIGKGGDSVWMQPSFYCDGVRAAVFAAGNPCRVIRAMTE